MGCWNGTCMLSNLPIFHGEDIKLIVMIDNSRSGSSFCEPFDYYRIVPTILNAEYDDYGRGEDIEEPLGSFVLNNIEEDLDWESFFERIHREKIEVTDFMGDLRHVQFAMIRSDVFDKIISAVSISRWNEPDLTLSDVKMIGYRYIQDLKELYTGEDISMQFVNAMMLREKNWFGRLISYHGTSFAGKSMIAAIDKAVIENDMVFAKLLVEKGAEALCLVNFMSVGRLSVANTMSFSITPLWLILVQVNL